MLARRRSPAKPPGYAGARHPGTGLDCCSSLVEPEERFPVSITGSFDELCSSLMFPWPAMTTKRLHRLSRNRFNLLVHAPPPRPDPATAIRAALVATVPSKFCCMVSPLLSGLLLSQTSYCGNVGGFPTSGSISPVSDCRNATKSFCSWPVSSSGLTSLDNQGFLTPPRL